MVDQTPTPGYITVLESAKQLGVTAQRVRQLIRERELAADRVGTSYLVRIEDVELRASLAPASTRAALYRCSIHRLYPCLCSNTWSGCPRIAAISAAVQPLLSSARLLYGPPSIR